MSARTHSLRLWPRLSGLSSQQRTWIRSTAFESHSGTCPEPCTHESSTKRTGPCDEQWPCIAPLALVPPPVLKMWIRAMMGTATMPAGHACFRLLPYTCRVDKPILRSQNGASPCGVRRHRRASGQRWPARAAQEGPTLGSRPICPRRPMEATNATKAAVDTTLWL